MENKNGRLDKSHLIKAKEVVSTWPKWKQEVAYSSSSDYISNDDQKNCDEDK
jgi:hypothetical protein